MKAAALPIDELGRAQILGSTVMQPQERFADELIMHLERDQFVAATSQPVGRAALGAYATAGLWALRIFVVLVSLMVLYTFIDQLR
jgi:hypothetical protein